MSELNRHIKKLLSENDVAIIPHFGGFLAHYIPAVRDSKNNLFIPPKRSIGFNQQLKLNDGLLIQSYMDNHNVSLQEASNLMKADIQAIKLQLEDSGSFSFDGIGTVFCNTNEKYSFKELETPFDCPLFFGMRTFEMFEIKELESSKKKLVTNNHSSTPNPNLNRKLNDFLGGVAVLCLIVASFFMFSPSVENSAKVNEENLAKVLPLKVWDFSLANSSTEKSITAKKDTTLIEEVQPVEPLTFANIKEAAINAKTEAALPVVEAQVRQTDANFHIIVASLIPLKKAEVLVEQLKKQGFEQAQIINRKGKRRVSLGSYETRQLANQTLNTPSVGQNYPTAWILNNK